MPGIPSDFTPVRDIGADWRDSKAAEMGAIRERKTVSRGGESI
jgi:hypothetical protein